MWNGSGSILAVLGTRPEVIKLAPVIDALLWVRQRLPALAGNFVVTPAETARVLLVTAHRREHFGEPLRQICQAIRTLAEQNPDVEVIFPVHLNPNVQGPVRALLGGAPRIHLVPPLDYPCFVQVLSRCVMVLTDSGGIQRRGTGPGEAGAGPPGSHRAPGGRCGRDGVHCRLAVRWGDNRDPVGTRPDPNLYFPKVVVR